MSVEGKLGEVVIEKYFDGFPTPSDEESKTKSGNGFCKIAEDWCPEGL
jgi:hypothetical protein